MAIEIGDPVVTADGETIGHVAGFLVEPNTCRASHVLVSEGLLFPHTVQAAVSLIARAEEHQVTLSIAADAARELPGYAHADADGGEAERVELRPGMDVFSADGEGIGELHSVTLDADSFRPSALLVTRGGLFSEDADLPGDAIRSVTSGSVHLGADRERIEAWSRDRSVLLF